ncbi:MAG: hypothetical protein ACK5TY_03465, partial [Verrucomicrobiota bacterium]
MEYAAAAADHPVPGNRLPMCCVVDTQLPPALARPLKSPGSPSRTCSRHQPAGRRRPPIWQHAIKNEAGIVSKNGDLAHLFSQGGLRAWSFSWRRIASRKNFPPRYQSK